MANLTSSSNPSENFWAVVPAAGIGARMASDRPKQYLPLAGKTVIEHSLDRLLNHPMIKGAVIAISGDDEYWAGLNYQHKKPFQLAAGGAERCDSVRNALQALLEIADKNDWVLVHDAARPCVRADDISELINACKHHPVGGVLAMPAKDTIKQAAVSGSTDSIPTIASTVDRSSLWQAQTPQMFRLGALYEALRQALAAGATITDEASAMEWSGQSPVLVESHGYNLKITCPEDLALAEFYFSQAAPTSI